MFGTTIEMTSKTNWLLVVLQQNSYEIISHLLSSFNNQKEQTY